MSDQLNELLATHNYMKDEYGLVIASLFVTGMIACWCLLMVLYIAVIVAGWEDILGEY